MTTVRGTTPTIRFKLPFLTSEISKIEVYFGQPNLLVTKTTEDCTLDGKIVSVMLSQEDTLMFNSDLPLSMQLRFVFTNGSVGASKVIESEVERILKDGEIDVGD